MATTGSDEGDHGSHLRNFYFHRLDRWMSTPTDWEPLSAPPVGILEREITCAAEPLYEGLSGVFVLFQEGPRECQE